MTELEKQLLATLKHISSAIERQLELIAERAPGQFLDKRPVVHALRSHARKAYAAIAAAEAAKPAPNYPAVPDGWPEESWLINTILKFRIGETPHGIETAQRCARLISRRYNAALLAAAPAPAQVEQPALAGAHLQIVEQIAQQWDECEYEDSGGNIDIGAAIRAAGARLAAEAKGERDD